MKIFIVSLVTFISFGVLGQLSVSTGLTPTQYVQNYLIGSGVTVSNVTFVGNAQQLGSFSGTNSNIGFDYGLVLGSTDVTELQGVGTDIIAGQTNVSGVTTNSTNGDLLSVAQSVTSNPDSYLISEIHDLALLEFDFVPQSDLVTFNFVFGSDEYTTYVNSQYNDVFGFFVSGPGITGPYSSPAAFPNGSMNLALVPGTSSPITISTIYPTGTFSGDPNGLNPQYYVDNTTGTTNALNGFTVPIPISFPVQCGETYHFKFAVADCQDDYLGTVVFLQGGSFASQGVDIAVATVSGDTTVIENCSDAQFIFSRPQDQLGDTLIVNYDIGGTATNNVDYTGLINPVTFLPGEDSITLTLHPVGDGISEGPESVIITAITVTACGDTVITTGTIYIIDGPELNIVETDTLIHCTTDSVQVSAYVTNGYGPYTYQWSYLNQTGDTAYVPGTPNGSYDYYVTATDACGNTGMDTVTVVVNQTLAIDTMMTFDASACANDGAVSGMGEGITGQPHYHWEGPNTGGPVHIDASVMQNLSPGWYVFTISDNYCSVTDSVYLNGDPGPIAQIGASDSSGCDPLDVSFTNSSQNANTFHWDFGNGNTANVTDLSSQSQTYTSSATIMLIASDNGNCPDTAMVSVQIVQCGCMDPLASNFDPLAQQDNGSCIYPIPSVEAPNIFTPNGDGSNDVFELTTVNTVDINLTIVNRWGNLMYSGSGLNPSWDGKDAPEGIYFYQYTVKGQTGDELSGQGFVQLIR